MALGGVPRLLEYQKRCDDETLVDTIYYAFSKLSSRGTFLPCIYGGKCKSMRCVYRTIGVVLVVVCAHSAAWL